MTSNTLTEMRRVTIRFAGDSGDGMQLAGNQFANISAIVGNDVATLPNYPAEIRAPAGSIGGVSSFQLCFAAEPIYTPGDSPDLLVAMNPAALKANLSDLSRGKMIVINSDEFTPQNLKKAGYQHNPAEDNSLDGYHLFEVPISSMNHRALEDSGLSKKEIGRSNNFFALGLMCWLFNRPLDRMLEKIDIKFGKNLQLADANKKSLKAGFAFGDTAEFFTERYCVPSADLTSGEYRTLTGSAATALGFLTAAQLAHKTLFYGSYPITPASDVLHELSRFKEFGVVTFQAEDEIAAMGATIGAAFGGAIALTGTSGPGLALKSEAIGLAVMTELPAVIIDVQRAGPSTGMPTKTEQGDLLQAVYGRNGESPVVVIAPSTPADCFDTAIEAVRIATTYMTPVIFMTDGYLANGSEPWKIVDPDNLKPIEIRHPRKREGKEFLPYERDPSTLARLWALPGTRGLEHRIGSLEKTDGKGDVSTDAENHHHMVTLRQRKIDGISTSLTKPELFGESSGRVLVVGWGSTFGAIRSAVGRLQNKKFRVSHLHLRHIRPFPPGLLEIFKSFEQILVPELNLGQLKTLLRNEFLFDFKGYNRVTGQPFSISELEAVISRLHEDSLLLDDDLNDEWDVDTVVEKAKRAQLSSDKGDA